jgi:hypothetical protein
MSRDVILEDYLTYIHRVMLVRFGTRVRVSHNSHRGPKTNVTSVFTNVVFSIEGCGASGRKG